MAKIKSFKGRRLIADLSIESVAAELNIDVNNLRRIESLEDVIRAYNDFLEAKMASLED